MRGLEGEQAAAVLLALVLACSLPIAGVAAVGSVGAQEQFKGKIALNGNQATSSTSWSYDINDVEAAKNLSVELTGREVLEQRSQSTVTESSTLNLDPRGTAKPRNATMRLTGVDTVSSETRSGSLAPGGSDSITVGGNDKPTNASLTISGSYSEASRSRTGTVDGSTSESISSGSLSNTNQQIAVTSLDSGGSHKTDVHTSTQIYSGESETITASTSLDKITDVRFQLEGLTDNTGVEIELYVDGNSFGVIDVPKYSEVTYSTSNPVSVSGGSVDLKFAVVDPDTNAYFGMYDFTPEDYIELVDSGTESVTIGGETFTSTGTRSANFNDGSINIESSGGSASYDITWTERDGVESPSVSVGSSTVSHNGILDGSVTEPVDLSTGPTAIDASYSGSGLSYDLSWTEHHYPSDPTIQLDGGATTLTHTGTLGAGQTTSKSISLTTGTHSASISSTGPVEAAIEWEDVSTTDNPTVSINGQTTSYTGTLAAGQTTSLDVSDNWIQEGTNTVEIDMADPGGGPSPQVGVSYSHNAATSASASIQSSTWQEDVEITRSFASDQQNVEATIPLPDNVVDIGSVEMARDGGGGWTSVPESSYSHDGDLQVSVGDIVANESVSVRTTASKVRMQSGEVRVLDPTTEGNDLSTTVEIVDDAGTDPVVVDVSETVSSGRSHVVTSSEWPASDSVRYQSDGTQELRLPDAVGGSNATIATAPFDVEPRTGDAVLRVENQTEPRVTIEPGSTTGDELSLTWFDAKSSEYYELYDVDNDRQIDTGQANSPVTFDLEDGSTTYTIGEWEPPSQVVGIAGGDSGSGAGPPLLLLVSLLGVVGSVVIGRRLGIGWLPVPAVVVIVLIGGELTTSRSLLATISGDLLRGSSGPLLAIVAAVLGVGLLWVIDSRTQRDIPTAAFAIPAVAGLGWLVSEVVSSVPEPLIALGGGAGVVVGVLAIDRGTSISVPRSVTAGAGLLSAGWTIETIAPGTLTRPLEAGIAEVAPLLALAAVAVVILWIRR